MADLDHEDDKLLAELGVEVTAKKVATRTPQEERVIAGFEDILKFHAEHGRAPQHGEDRDIFERLYAVRLDRLRELTEFHPLLAELDTPGLLAMPEGLAPAEIENLDDEDLLAELGIEADAPAEEDITTLRHVKPRQEIRAAEEVTSRRPCAAFDQFKPLFEAVRADLKSGVREARKFGESAAIRKGEFFILGGQIAYVAEVPEEFTIEHDHPNGRLRVIFDNGTESEPLLRSFQRALYKDEQVGRRITDPAVGPLFGGVAEDGDLESGTIYVLRSLSEHPVVAERRDLIHKIGVTGGDVGARVANARHDPTYLLADVEIVATYRLYNINRAKLEAVFHRVFGRARLDLMIPDRFGQAVRPREWFLVPLHVINEVVERITNQTITDYEYDPATASLVQHADGVSQS